MRENRTFDPNGAPTLLRVDYDQHSNSYHPGMALERALEEEEKGEKWESSDCFVTAMKCGGKGHTLTPKCLLRGDLEPVGCTLVTPHVTVDVGDHLLVRDTFGHSHSVLVYDCIDERTVLSMPSLAQSPRGRDPIGKLCLLDYNEVYRVNYPESLPVEEILRRCCSPEGQQMLTEATDSDPDASGFVSWAKVGKSIPISAAKLTQKRQLAQIRPREYAKLLSVDDIQVGDHLFVPNIAYRWHFLVTEREERSSCSGSSHLFSVIYCLRGTVKETREKLDPTRDDIFKILYPEEFPPSLAISNSRSLLGTHKVGPSAKAWFVRWAKTGSQEGLEVDFLKRRSLPVSKSRVLSFAQLDLGDYLVQDRGRFSIRRHYLVVSVESANTCTVIGTWKGRVQQTQLTLDHSTYHRIIYEEGVCLHAAESIRKARECMRSQFNPSLFRRRFVNFVKTTDSVEVDVENLPEYHLLLQRERVDRTSELRLGDHLEMPVKGFQGTSYRDMIVTALPARGKVMVVSSQERGLVERELEWESGGKMELYRVKYLERVGAEEGIKILRTRIDSTHMNVSV